MSWHLDRLLALGVRVSTTGGAEATGLCPLHEDHASSFAVNVESGLWKCYVPTCRGFKGGNLPQLVLLMTGRTLGERFPVPEAEVEAFRAALLADEGALTWLRELRGISIETATAFRLGLAGERIVIPITLSENTVNVRRHAIRKDAKIKSLPYREGYGSPARLFPEAALAAERILLCEGELDAICATQRGFAAVTVTGGAGDWRPEFTERFRGKAVDVCYDVDKAGREGAALVCGLLTGVAREVRNVVLDIDSPANADITDFFVTHGRSADDLRRLIEATPPWSAALPAVVEQGPLDVELAAATSPASTGRWLRFRAVVSGKDTVPYLAPKTIQLTCKMALKVCKFCSIGQANGRLTHEIPGDRGEVLKMIDCTEDQQREQVRRAAGIYPRCPKFEMEVTDHHALEDVRLIPEVGYGVEGGGEYVVRTGFRVGGGLSTNRTYEFEGRALADPRSQYATLLLPKATPVKDSLDRFEVTPELAERLKVFQVRPGETVAERLQLIAQDLTTHVTRIYDRLDIVTVVDLVYHSVLRFRFRGQVLKKGWTEALILGDTRCGKTETVSRLLEHYRAGELATGENATFAGLIGGMQQTGTRWSIIWGKLPLNDRRLFVIDEASGIPVEEISRMSGVRSSGIAEVVKVQTEKTHARTRLIWIGNPRSPRPLASYDAGVLAVQELIGRPEDVARFDVALTVASGEVPVSVINRAIVPGGTPTYTSDLCHDLVLWAWSRRIDDVEFAAGAEELCLELATEQAARYSQAVPLVEPAEQRVKIARLAVSVAARLFATPDGRKLVVTVDHVRFVVELLDRLYDRPSMGYREWSKFRLAEQQLQDPEAVRAAVEKYGSDLVTGLLDRTFLHATDLEDLTGAERKEVRELTSLLVRMRALRHGQSAYTKTAAFIQFLREMKARGVPVKKMEEKPPF